MPIKNVIKKKYFDYLIDPSIQGVNRHFFLSLENINEWTSYIRYFLPIVKIKDYSDMIDGQNIFDQPAESDMRTYDNSRKTGTCQ